VLTEETLQAATAPDQAAPILQARDISLQFGGVRALSDAKFEVRAGELFSIIGPNGAA
jgi:branched-chain amino acid transport system ATP-binding protein